MAHTRHAHLTVTRTVARASWHTDPEGNERVFAFWAHATLYWGSDFTRVLKGHEVETREGGYPTVIFSIRKGAMWHWRDGSNWHLT
jgi:hypothetical protein